MLCVFVRLCAHENQMMKVREEVNFSGFIYPFFEEKVEGLFKDFQGQISHFSRTPFSAKKSLESVFFGSSPTWAILSWRSFCVYSFLPLENLKGWIKLVLKFKDFSAPTAIIFQGLSRTFEDFQGVCEPWLLQLTNNRVRGTKRQFSKNICLEDDLRSRIFRTLFCCKIACLPASPRIFEHLKNAITAHF